MPKQVFTVYPGAIKWDPVKTNVSAALLCNRCNAKVPLDSEPGAHRNGFDGLVCAKCGEPHFFGTCSACMRTVGVSNEKMKTLESGGTITCPEPACGEQLAILGGGKGQVN